MCKMKPYLYFLIVPVIVLTGMFKQTFAASADTVDVATIIDRSEKAYHQLSVYLDSGKVINAYDISGRVNKTAKLFKTAFSNNGDFNFEYYELGKSNSLYTINRSANIVRSWWGVTNKLVDPAPSLRLALSGALGVSSGTSMLIPGILLTNDISLKVSFYHTLGATELNGSEVVNGVDCYKMKSIAKNGRKTTTWVAKKDYFIRKIETEYIIYPAQTQAFIKKIDSLAKLKLSVKDTSTVRADSIRQVTQRLMNDMAKLSKNVDGDKTGAYNVKETFWFYPYTLKKPSPELFKFRPNREIEL
jgi:hypothetical protein